VNDGAWFGVLLASARRSSAVAATGSPARAIEPRADRRTRRLGVASPDRRAVARRGRARGQGRAILDEFRGTRGKEVSQNPTRLAELSSSNRWRWWQEAWSLWRDAPLAGKGAATFEVARRDIRQGSITTTEAHNVALQFLAETGIVGFLLLLGAIGTGVTAAVCAVRRAAGGERAAAAALALGLGAYVLHGLVDIDWEFVAVTAPAFFVLGALIGLGARRRARVSRPVWALAGVAALGVLYSLVAPYASARLVDSAYERSPRTVEAARLGRHARPAGSNPLATDPLLRARRRRVGAGTTSGRAPVLPRGGRPPAGELEHLVRARLVRVLHGPVPERAPRPRPRVRPRPVRAGRAPGRAARPGAGEGARALASARAEDQRRASRRELRRVIPSSGATTRQVQVVRKRIASRRKPGRYMTIVRA
jgi:hypothetical protein